jgi:hypothetical protein
MLRRQDIPSSISNYHQGLDFTDPSLRYGGLRRASKLIYPVVIYRGRGRMVVDRTAQYEFARLH